MLEALLLDLVPVGVGEPALDDRDRLGLLVAQVLAELGARRGQTYGEGGAGVVVGVLAQPREPRGARRQHRVDALVLGFHRLEDLGLLGGGDGEQAGPETPVLATVVQVQRLGEQCPSVRQRAPRRAVGGRRHGCGGREHREVAPERVVHHVHHGHVDRARVGRRLTGQSNLGRPRHLVGRVLRRSHRGSSRHAVVAG